MSASVSSTFWAGAIASVISTAAFFPLEMVEARMQTDSSYAQRNLWQNVKFVIEKEGYFALYLGLFPCLVGSAINCGFYFVLYDYFSFVLISSNSSSSLSSSRGGGDPSLLLPLYQIISGMLANSITCFLSNPFFLIRIRVIMCPEKFKDALDVTWNPLLHLFYAMDLIISEESLFSLWNGVGASLFGTIEWGLQFMAYDQLKAHFMSSPLSGLQFSWEYFLIGAIAKAFALLLTFPYQVIRAKLQASSSSSFSSPSFSSTKSSSSSSTSIVACVAKIKQESGWKGFFVGLIPNLIRQIPPAGLMFWLVELIKSLLFVNPHSSSSSFPSS